MKIDGNQVILNKEEISDWLCYELGMVYTHRHIEDKLNRHLDLLEGALGLLELPPELFKKILVLDPTDENLFRAYRTVIQEIGPSNFNFLAKLGGDADGR